MMRFIRNSVGFVAGVVAIVGIAFVMNGCGSMAALGTVNKYLTSAKNPVVQEAAVAGVTAAIASIGGDAKVTAALIKGIAVKIQADAASPTATVATLEGALNTEITKLAPNPAEAAAFAALASGLELALNAYISTNPGGPVVSTTLVSIQGVCAAVILATSFYGV